MTDKKLITDFKFNSMDKQEELQAPVLWCCFQSSSDLEDDDDVETPPPGLVPCCFMEVRGRMMYDCKMEDNGVITGSYYFTVEEDTSFADDSQDIQFFTLAHRKMDRKKVQKLLSVLTRDQVEECVKTLKNFNNDFVDYVDERETEDMDELCDAYEHRQHNLCGGRPTIFYLEVFGPKSFLY